MPSKSDGFSTSPFKSATTLAGPSFPVEKTEFKHDVLAGARPVDAGADDTAFVVRNDENDSETRAFRFFF